MFWESWYSGTSHSGNFQVERFQRWKENPAQSVHKLYNVGEKLNFSGCWWSSLFTKHTRNFLAAKLMVLGWWLKKFKSKNVSSLTKLVKFTSRLILGLEPLFSSSYWESTLSKVASTTPDIMFHVCILVLTCGQLDKANYYIQYLISFLWILALCFFYHLE